jgi:hypothetical protein
VKYLFIKHVLLDGAEFVAAPNGGFLVKDKKGITHLVDQLGKHWKFLLILDWLNTFQFRRRFPVSRFAVRFKGKHLESAD